MLKGFRNLLLVFLVGIAALAPACAAEQPLQKISMAMTASAFHYLAYYLPEYAGFNKEEGLKLDIVRVKSGTQEAAAVMGGSVDIACMGFPHVIDASHKGGNLVAISTGFDIYPITLVLSNAGLKKAGITDGMSLDDRVQRLKGLKLAISSPGSSTDLLIRTVLLNRGIDPDKAVTLMPVGAGAAEVAAMQRGAVDGFAYSAPFTTMAVSKGMGKFVVDPVDGNVPEFRNAPYQVIATSREALVSKKDLLTRFVRAFTKGLKFAQEHPAEAKIALRKAFPEVSDDEYSAAFDSHFKGIPKTPVVSQDQLDQTLKMMNLTEKTKLSASMSEVADMTFAKTAKEQVFGK